MVLTYDPPWFYPLCNALKRQRGHSVVGTLAKAPRPRLPPPLHLPKVVRGGGVPRHLPRS